jgi:16S rRNA (adenine1518-N6/adenine1519-N6)-dimethyltransferase
MTISDIMSTLERLGASPRKSLGQNFLHDKNLAKWIVEKLEIQKTDHVIEIGPGLGALTSEIISRGVSATLLEKDKLFSSFLRQKFLSDRVALLEGDALAYDVREAFPRQPAKVIGNLPYYMSTPILFHFTRQPCPFRQLVFTLQKEVADRLVARPRSAAFGSLSVLVQARWHVIKLRVLPPSVFFPPPRVDSAVVLLKPKQPEEVPLCDWVVFERLVKAGFSERRKQVRKALGKLSTSEAVGRGLEAAAIHQSARAEEISLEQWLALTNALSPLKEHGTNPDEMLQVVDRDDLPTAERNRAQVHKEKLLHRAVHVLVTNRQGEVLLQKRSFRKDQFPRCWDSSASGHVDGGESYDECATRELREELGLVAPVRFLAKIPASEQTGFEFIALYTASGNEPLDLDQFEIESASYFPLETIERWIERRPSDFAPGFLECYRVARVCLEKASSRGAENLAAGRIGESLS